MRVEIDWFCFECGAETMMMDAAAFARRVGVQRSRARRVAGSAARAVPHFACLRRSLNSPYRCSLGVCSFVVGAESIYLAISGILP